MTELVDYQATEMASMLAIGEISARELLEAHLSRIDAVNDRVNAIITHVPELAMERAAAADAAHAAGETTGPLHGLPIAHKDLTETAGIRTTYGSPLTHDFVPQKNSLIVDRLQNAGAVTVGKTNVPEHGAGSHTFNPLFGSTLNPYDTSKSAGGSSGGAAAALATRMVPIADGSDMGGSLRNPAAFNNVVGFRVSPGRIPSFPKTDIWGHLSTEGPLARTVGDVVLMLEAMAGPDSRAPTSLAEPGSHFADVLDTAPGVVRVAWAPTLGGLPIAADVRQTLAGVPDLLAGLGWHVGEDCPDLRDADEVFNVRRAWAFELNLGPLYDADPMSLKDTIRWNIEQARGRSLKEHADAVRKHTALFHRVARFFDHYDVLACPTTQVAPFDVDEDWVRSIDGKEMHTYIEWMRSCSDVTVMGCPAISVPAGFTADGLPVGLQLVGRPRGDADLLRIAHAYERATEHWRRTPSALRTPDDPT
jgi:amidase